MAQAEYHTVLEVDRDRLFSAILNYENYPQFVEGCKAVQIEKSDAGLVRVTYHINLLSQDVKYTLDHRENSKVGRVEWNLVESNFLKKNEGHWEVKDLGKGKTDVVYSVDLEFKVPVPSFILNRLVKGNLPGMVKSFEKQAQNT